jgi:hypothetical protein
MLCMWRPNCGVQYAIAVATQTTGNTLSHVPDETRRWIIFAKCTSQRRRGHFGQCGSKNLRVWAGSRKNNRGDIGHRLQVASWCDVSLSSIPSIGVRRGSFGSLSCYSWIFFFIYSFIGHTYWKRQLSAVIVSPICCVLQHNPWPKYSTQGLLS